MLRPVVYLLFIFITTTAFATNVRTVDTPASKNSGQPYLTIDSQGQILMSWVESVSEYEHILKFSSRSHQGQWATPKIIARGKNWFINWADFPSLLSLPEGNLAAHWLVKKGKEKYAYDIHVSQSNDSGETWSTPIVPYNDPTVTEHGFVSMFPLPSNEIGLVWLDGRDLKRRKAMTLRYTSIDSIQHLKKDVCLDAKTCDCCQVATAIAESGPIVVYRDRTSSEIRDISIVGLENGKWSKPKVVNHDGWKIKGCPVNGPSVASNGKDVAVAWFTAASNKPQVRLSFSKDSGKTFGNYSVIDLGNPIGRVKVLFLEPKKILVSWIENVDGKGSLMIRTLNLEGNLSSAITVSTPGLERSVGFPQIVHSKNTLVLAWVDQGVKLAEMNVQ